MEVKEWLGWDDKMCIDIVDRKYLISKDILGHKETFDEFVARVTNGDKKFEKIFLEGKFIPAGRILANRGLFKYGIKITYSNCYVTTTPSDNIESIYDTACKLARTFSYGGGSGVNISNLAPAGAKVNNSAKKSTGAVSFIETFSNAAETIGQENRRGALMVGIKDTHPDLIEFITHKTDLSKSQGANISVMMSDDFFRACKEEKDWELTFTRPETGETINKTIPANDILTLLAKTAWDYAEPGVLYWDTISNYNMLEYYDNFEFACTNPCGELPLPAGGSCLLGAMNLSKYYISKDDINYKKFRESYSSLTGFDGIYDDSDINFDFVSFYTDVMIAVFALNDILNEGLELHPLEEQRRTVKEWRQIGLGVMGIADLLYKCKLPYGSNESIQLMDKIGYVMDLAAVEASAEYAAKYGCFEHFDYEKTVSSDWYRLNVLSNPHFSDTIISIVDSKVRQYGMRNSQLLTIAPTGTISTIFGVSGGIEPIFSLHFTRTTKSLFGKDVTYDVYPKPVKEWMEENKITELNLDELPSYFVTARDIPYEQRIKMQSVWQSHIDNSISSTINLPESTTIDDVKDLIINAWANKLKGITIYRDGCKRDAILNDKTKPEKKKVESNNKTQKIDKGDNLNMLTREELGRRLDSSTYYIKIACGHIYITISKDKNGKPIEVFMSSSKSGGCSANAECLGRYASACLRSGMDPDMVVDITKGVKCPACTSMIGKGEHLDGLSCGDAMAKVLQEEYMRYKSGLNKELVKESSVKLTNEAIDLTKYTPQQLIDMGYCPECGHKLTHSNGCLVCTNCPFSKCG